MSDGKNTANILAALGAIAQLAPAAVGLVDTIKVATSAGRDITDDELAAAVANDQAASDALDAWIQANGG